MCMSSNSLELHDHIFSLDGTAAQNEHVLGIKQCYGMKQLFVKFLSHLSHKLDCVNMGHKELE